MRRKPTWPGIALHGLLAIWMAAVAVAPIWHAGHEAPQVRNGASGHEHHAGPWLCDATPRNIEPGVHCVLCKAQRQLSQYWTRTSGGFATLQRADSPAPPASYSPMVGEHSSLAPRAPPLG